MAETAAAGGTPPAKNSKKLIVIGAIVALLVVVLGAVFMLMLNQHEDDEDDGRPVVAAVPTFYPLENLVVNLADPGGDRFIQLGITLELADDKATEQVKQFMPSIRDSILRLVAQRTADELLLGEGKEKLAADILVEVSRPLGGGRQARRAADEYDDDYDDRPRRPVRPVRRVLFSSFIIQ